MRYPQTATYWGGPTPDGFGGFTFDAPLTLAVRWEDRVEKFVDAEGDEVRSAAVVYPQQRLDLGGYLYLGTSAAADPRTVNGAYRIRQVSRVTNLRATRTVHKAWL